MISLYQIRSAEIVTGKARQSSLCVSLIQSGVGSSKNGYGCEQYESYLVYTYLFMFM
jgi:hypothetical protein